MVIIRRFHVGGLPIEPSVYPRKYVVVFSYLYIGDKK